MTQLVMLPTADLTVISRTLEPTELRELVVMSTAVSMAVLVKSRVRARTHDRCEAHV